MNPEFANGLTARQNKLIRQFIRESGATVEDRQAVLRARQEIAETLAELMTSRKQKARHRSAAIRGISSSKPDPFTPTSGAAKGEEPKAPAREKLRRVESSSEGQKLVLLPAFEMSVTKRGGNDGR